MYKHYLKSVANRELSDNERDLENETHYLNGYSIQRPISGQRRFNRMINRKLILHFDARNTIFVADHSSRISVEQALNTYIAGVVWGTYKQDGHWECISDEPTLCTPIPGAISMYKLMERDIVKIPSDRARLRQKLGDFTQTEAGAKFVSYFDHHLSLLKWTTEKQYSEELTVTGLDGRRYHYLIPSFLHLVHHLHAEKLDFAIIIRTFGRDAPHILNALQLLANGQHPDFPVPISVRVNHNVERLNRQGDGFEYTFIDDSEKQVKLDNERDIYEHWNNCHGILGVVDDFVHWQSNNYHFSASKPLWFDPHDSKHQHIMFDDNIRVDDEDNILNLCRLHRRNGKAKSVTGDARTNGNQTLCPEEAHKFENVFFVQADLLESTAKQTYFIDKTYECVDNLDSSGMLA